MKQNILIASALTVLLTACGFHTQENKEVAPAKAAPQNQTAPTPTPAPRSQSQVNVGEAKLPADLINAIEAIQTKLRNSQPALKPGSVVLSGILTSQTDEDSVLKINSHLQVPLNEELLSTRIIDQDEQKIIDQAAGRKTYINIGCKDSQIGADQIAGLQKALMQWHGTFKHAHADKVFLCGNDAMTMKNTVVYANEIIMINSSFVISHGDNGLVNISARVLTLVGQNRINAVTKNADGSLTPGAPIFLNVSDDLNGSGSLLINQ